MSLTQISKIQISTGNEEDLPQLDQGELGFATDTRRMFVGNDLSLYPPSGPTTSQTEILTEHSSIRFSQVDGNGKDLAIDPNSLTDGQVIRFDAISDKWTAGGGAAQSNIDLGNVEYVKIRGGAGGFVIETDATGNLSWGPKGYTFAKLSAASKSSPVVLTTETPHYFINSAPITVSDIAGLANTVSQTGTVTTSNVSAIVFGTGTNFSNAIVGHSIYNGANVFIGVIGKINTPTELVLRANATTSANNVAFRTSYSPLNGNVGYAKVIDEFNFSLYSDSTLTTPIDTSGVQIQYISSGRAVGNVLPNTSGTGAAGSNYQIQYAFNGLLSTSPTLTYSSSGVLSATKFSGNGAALSNLTGANVVGTVGNAQSAINAQTAIIANTVSANVQGNITRVGTLTQLTVSNVVTATGLIANALVNSSGVVLNTNGTGFSDLVVSRSGISANTVKNGTSIELKSDSVMYPGNNSVVLGSSLHDFDVFGLVDNQFQRNLTVFGRTGDVKIRGNLIIGQSVVGSIDIAKTVSACNQPNITAVGTLTSLAVSGNSVLDNTVINGTTSTLDLVSSTQVVAKELVTGGSLFPANGVVSWKHSSSSDVYKITHTGGNLTFSLNNASFANLSNSKLTVPAIDSVNESHFSSGGYIDPVAGKAGALKVSGGLIADKVTTANEIVVRSLGSLPTGQLNMIQQKSPGVFYNAMFRNDGDSTYLLVSNSAPNADQATIAGWNSYRPFYVNNDSGTVWLGYFTNGNVNFGTTVVTKDIVPHANGFNIGSNNTPFASVTSRRFRAGKGASNGDNSGVGYAFEDDGDTGLFAEGGAAFSSSKLVLSSDSQKLLIIVPTTASSEGIASVQVKTTDPDSAFTVDGGAKIKGSIRTDKSVVASMSMTAPVFNGALQGTAAFARRLETPRRINGVLFDGSGDIYVDPYFRTEGVGQVSHYNQDGTVNIANNTTAAILDVFPPIGYTMTDLVFFFAGFNVIDFSGDVNYDDSIVIRWSYLSDRIRIKAYNTERRQIPFVNHSALWRRK